MKKKTTPYKFENPTFDFMFNVDINPKNHEIETIDINYNTPEQEVSQDILKLQFEGHDFLDKLYEFVKNYNEKYKTLKMKKEHQSQDEYSEGPQSFMTVVLVVKNGVGSVSYFPLHEDRHEYEKKMWGDFNINKTDLLKFLNDYSKKIKFNQKKEIENFKRVGNWYSVEVNDIKYNVIIQKESYSYKCDPSSVIIFDENHKWISPHPDRKNIYDKIESIMNKVDFKYDDFDNK